MVSMVCHALDSCTHSHSRSGKITGCVQIYRQSYGGQLPRQTTQYGCEYTTWSGQYCTLGRQCTHVQTFIHQTGRQTQYMCTVYSPDRRPALADHRPDYSCQYQRESADLPGRPTGRQTTHIGGNDVRQLAGHQISRLRSAWIARTLVSFGSQIYCAGRKVFLIRFPGCSAVTCFTEK